MLTAIALRLEVVGGGLGQRHAAVLAARASHGDGELLLALGHVAGHDDVEQRAPLLLELLRLRTVQHEIAHRGVEARERAQVGIVVGFGRKRTSMTRSASRGDPCLKPKEYTVTESASALLSRRDEVADGGAQLRRQHVGGVDDVVRARAQLLEKLALALDALADGAPVLAERMAPATGLVARNELLRRRRRGR